MIKCEICDKEFRTTNGVNGHKRVHNEHNGKYKRLTTPNRNSFKKSTCLNCNKEFIYRKTASQGKYCSNQCHADWQWKNITIPKILSGKKVALKTIIRYLMEIYGYKCDVCGITDWNGKKLTLDVDHIDGNSLNNDISNLRLICPNCHRQTETWGNSKRKRKMRVMGQMGRRCLDMAG